MRDDDREPFFRPDDALLAALIVVVSVLFATGRI
jgi:hypothetical protein